MTDTSINRQAPTSRPYAQPEPGRALRVADLSDEAKPREKALNQGISALTDAELLAIILAGGIPGMSVIDMAQHMLFEANNSLINLEKTGMREMIRRFKGVGEAKAVSIAAAFEIGHRYYRELESRNKNAALQITSSDDAYRYIRGRLQSLDYEEVWVLMLSRSSRIKGEQRISQGGTASTIVDPKIVFRHALDYLANGIILVHNHPSESLNPSADDDALTRRIAECGRLLDIKVLDHIIVSTAGYYSYNDHGRMP
ncbi:MAG: DNA repair protein RadC [Muribaculaceae bacterium]|nr:DNA repair protein RadC [Muribaculaceae bacterium]